MKSRQIHVMSGLVEKRARKLGEIRAAEFQVRRLKVELEQIDAVIRMFRPGYDVDAIPAKTTFQKTPAALPKGAGSRMALDVLRETGKAMSAEELAIAVLIRSGKEPDKRSVAMLQKTIHSTFSRSRKALVRYDRNSWPGRWHLAVKPTRS